MVSLRNRKTYSRSFSKHMDGNQAGRLEMLFDGICNLIEADFWLHHTFQMFHRDVGSGTHSNGY